MAPLAILISHSFSLFNSAHLTCGEGFARFRILNGCDRQQFEIWVPAKRFGFSDLSGPAGIFGERHLEHLLREYEAFYNSVRPHQGVENRPIGVIPFPVGTGPARAVPHRLRISTWRASGQLPACGVNEGNAPTSVVLLHHTRNTIRPHGELVMNSESQ